jgi:hypothetical protein
MDSFDRGPINQICAVVGGPPKLDAKATPIGRSARGYQLGFA